MLVVCGNVLPAQSELLDDHVLRNARALADFGSGQPPLRKVRSGRYEPDLSHCFSRLRQAYGASASRMQRIKRSSSAVTRFGMGRPSPQRIQRMPISSPSPISA